MQCGTAFKRGYPYRRLSTAYYDHGIISIIIVSSPRELPQTVVSSFTSNSTAVVVTPRPIQRAGPIGASTLYGPSPSGKVNSQNAGTSRIDESVTPSCFDCLFPYYSNSLFFYYYSYPSVLPACGGKGWLGRFPGAVVGRDFRPLRRRYSTVPRVWEWGLCSTFRIQAIFTSRLPRPLAGEAGDVRVWTSCGRFPY